VDESEDSPEGESDAESSEDEADLSQNQGPTVDPEILARFAQIPTVDPEILARFAQIPTVDPEILARFAQMKEPAPPKELVPEADEDEQIEEEQEIAPRATEVPPVLAEVLTFLHEREIAAELLSPSDTKFREHVVEFELPAGRSKRKVTIVEDTAEALLATEITEWRSLERYDGIWNGSSGTIELVIRGGRMGPSLQFAIPRLAGSSPKPDSVGRHELMDGDTGVHITLGESSDLGRCVLRSGSRFVPRHLFTMEITNVRISTTDEADALAETVCDSLAFDLLINQGFSIVPQRLEDKESLARRRTRVRRALGFPRNAYPHAPVLLYRAGSERSLFPLLRYWAYYQVLEYFFPKYVEANALKQLSRFLKSPGFDPHREEDVMQALVISARGIGRSAAEVEQLTMTLEAVVIPEEVRDLIAEGGMQTQLTSKSELTNRLVNLTQMPSLLPDLSRRIYDIRCRIVHSKSSSDRSNDEGLLPGTHHDDLVIPELPVIEYLAEQALISSSEPLKIPHQLREDSAEPASE
jgi:hypothetical protein